MRECAAEDGDEDERHAEGAGRGAQLSAHQNPIHTRSVCHTGTYRSDRRTILYHTSIYRSDRRTILYHTSIYKATPIR